MPFARNDSFLYCRVQKWVGGVDSRGRTHKRNLSLRKKQCLVIEKYVEDVKQDEKSVPDLVESTMKGSGLVGEELRPILFKLDPF